MSKNEQLNSQALEVETFKSLLRQADIFKGMTNTQLEMLSRICHEKILDAGEIIFCEGSSGNDLFIIYQGEVNILVNSKLVLRKKKQTEAVEIITTLGSGQSFGEMALVDHGLRSATAQAAQKKTRLLVIDGIRLCQLCEEYPMFGYRLMYNLAADIAIKLRHTDFLLRQELLKQR